MKLFGGPYGFPACIPVHFSGSAEFLIRLIGEHPPRLLCGLGASKKVAGAT
jgi:hypothetical protein